MEIPRGFKGVWIPKEIWLSPDLNIKEKILLVEIDSLDRENGCYAKNKHFSDFIGISEHRISRMISKLKANGHIVIDQKNIKGNTIRTMRSAYAKMSMRSVAPMQKSTEGVCENEQASISNTLSNTTIAPEIGAQAFSLKDEIEKMYNNERRDLNIIALYLEEKKPNIQSKDQLQVTIKRHLRDAGNLKPFTNDQILGAIPKAKKITEGWTISTLVKVLTK